MKKPALTVDIHEAKTQLSKLVDRAAKGEPFVIAKAGKPMVKVAAVDAPAAPKRLGFLAGEIAVPKDLDRMGGAPALTERSVHRTGDVLTCSRRGGRLRLLAALEALIVTVRVASSSVCRVSAGRRASVGRGRLSGRRSRHFSSLAVALC